MPAVAALLAGMVRCIEEDSGEEVAEGATPESAALVDAALRMARHLLWIAAANGADAGRSERWVASVERLALQVEGLHIAACDMRPIPAHMLHITDDVLALAASAGGAHRPGIALLRPDLTPSQIESAIHSLLRRGMIRRASHGRYVIATLDGVV